ncbi:MAG: hypothetical protein H6Q85_1290, partial [candidate division NC10 bacterium]|nr:hypothetical protein [candidate division NC10 bacterium]
EATSARVALQLMRAGFTRVSVVRGGFPALLTAGVPVAPKGATTPAVPTPLASEGSSSRA